MADGYLPQPVVSEAPPAGKKQIEVTIRLKRGPTVRARIVDHNGNSVKGAAVFANGPISLNLFQGKAWQTWGEVNEAAQPAYTDDEGRFELQLGSATRLAISHASFDAWATAIPEGEDTIIRLPEPAQLEITYDIDGADTKGEIFYQMLGHDMPGFKGLETMRNVPIENGGTVVLKSLTPGMYQFSRYKMLELGDMGMGAMLERQYLELEPGEKKTIRYEREKGARLNGKINWPQEVELSGIVVSVNSIEKAVTPISPRATATKYSARVAAKNGDYQTERIPPGTYSLQAAAYEAQNQEGRFSTGIRVPGYRAETRITVPNSGEMTVPDLTLEKAEPRFDF